MKKSSKREAKPAGGKGDVVFEPPIVGPGRNIPPGGSPNYKKQGLGGSMRKDFAKRKR